MEASLRGGVGESGAAGKAAALSRTLFSFGLVRGQSRWEWLGPGGEIALHDKDSDFQDVLEADGKLVFRFGGGGRGRRVVSRAGKRGRSLKSHLHFHGLLLGVVLACERRSAQRLQKRCVCSGAVEGPCPHQGRRRVDRGQTSTGLPSGLIERNIGQR